MGKYKEFGLKLEALLKEYNVTFGSDDGVYIEECHWKEDDRLIIDDTILVLPVSDLYSKALSETEIRAAEAKREAEGKEALKRYIALETRLLEDKEYQLVKILF